MPVSRRMFLRRGGAAIVAAPAAMAGMENGLGDGTAVSNKTAPPLPPLPIAETATASVWYGGTFGVSLYMPMMFATVMVYPSSFGSVWMRGEED